MDDDGRPRAPKILSSPETTRQWFTEHGDAYRAETTEALLEGSDVATHWAAKVLAMLDSIEPLLDRLEAATLLLRDLYTSYMLSSGPPGHLISKSQMEAVGRFVGPFESWGVLASTTPQDDPT